MDVLIIIFLYSVALMATLAANHVLETRVIKLREENYRLKLLLNNKY